MRIVLSRDFAARFEQLDSSLRKQLFRFLEKLQAAVPEPLTSISTVDPRIRMARLDDEWRVVCLVTADQDRELLLLLNVLPHDEALAWGERRSVQVDEVGMLTLAEAGLSVPPAEPARYVPGFAGETTSGIDQLGITHDARALAALLAAKSLDPPLAVGLYGEWGTGKTFFMRTLEAEIAALDSLSCCRNVASVWFNAWHYAEGNLWASLVHHIFLSLHQEDSAQEKALSAALDKIHGIQQAKEEALAQIGSASNAVATARDTVEDLEREREAALEKAGSITATDVWASVEISSELRTQLASAATQIGLTGIGDSAREMAKTAEHIRDTVRRSGVLATARPWWKSPLVAGLVVATLVALTGWVAALAAGWNPTWPATLVGTIGGTVTWLTRQARRLRALLAPAERIQAELDGKLAAAEADHRAKITDARRRLEAKEADLAAARTALLAAEQRVAAAQAELGELSGSRLLERYLSERAGSDDYRRHLGVVAQAHQDLRDLDEHLRSALTDESAESPIDRIVLYIDDLDRCSPETVVRVLEAVHLLLALPMFIVVLGVDPNWLTKSLAVSHLDGHRIRAGEYLEKIFQLTYRLPPMSRQICADLLQHTAEATQPQLPTLDAVLQPTPEIRLYAEKSHPVTRSFGLDYTQALTLKASEIGWIRLVAPLVGASPRRAKRFVNIYRISKARILSEPGGLLVDSATRGLIVLVALLLGTSLPLHTALDDNLTLGAWLAEFEGLPEVAEFLADAGELRSLPMEDVVRHLPRVERFTWRIPERTSDAELA
jgi:hypothetical protein